MFSHGSIEKLDFNKRDEFTQILENDNLILIGARHVGKSDLVKRELKNINNKKILYMNKSTSILPDDLDDLVIIMDDFYDIILDCLNCEQKIKEIRLEVLNKILGKKNGLCLITSPYPAEWLIETELQQWILPTLKDDLKQLAPKLKSFFERSQIRFLLYTEDESKEIILQTKDLHDQIKNHVNFSAVHKKCKIKHKFYNTQIFGDSYDTFVPYILPSVAASVLSMHDLKFKSVIGEFASPFLYSFGKHVMPHILPIVNNSIVSEAVSDVTMALPVFGFMVLIDTIFAKHDKKSEFKKLISPELNSMSPPEIEKMESELKYPPRSLDGIKALLQSGSQLKQMTDTITSLLSTQSELQDLYVKLEGRLSHLENEVDNLKNEVKNNSDEISQIKYEVDELVVKTGAVPELSIDRADHYYRATQIIESTTKKLYLVERTPVLFLGPNKNKTYEVTYHNALHSWCDGIRNTNRMGRFYFCIPQTCDEIINENNYEFFIENLKYYKDLEKQSGGKLQIIALDEYKHFSFIIGDNDNALWIKDGSKVWSRYHQSDPKHEEQLLVLFRTYYDDLQEQTFDEILNKINLALLKRGFNFI